MTPPNDSPPRRPLVAPRPRAASQDDLRGVQEQEALERLLRAAKAEADRKDAELERERAAREAAEQRLSSGVFPPAVTQGPAPTPTRVELDPAETELVAGYRRGAKAMGKVGWVIGAIAALGAVGGAGVIGGQVAINPKPAKEAIVRDATDRLGLVETWRDDVESWQRGDYTDRGIKEALVLEHLCQTGFRAEGLRCEDVKDRVKQLRKDDLARWPELRKPPRLPVPKGQ